MCTHVCVILCACVFAILCMKMFVNFSYVLYACIPLICIIMGICALYVFFKVVKRFQFSKELYNFPIIIITLAGNREKE